MIEKFYPAVIPKGPYVSRTPDDSTKSRGRFNLLAMSLAVLLGFSSTFVSTVVNATESPNLIDDLEDTNLVWCIGPGAWSNSARGPRAQILALGAEIHRRWACSVVQLSHLNGVDTPAFDALIVDSQGQIVANCRFRRYQKFTSNNLTKLRKNIRECELKSTVCGWSQDLSAQSEQQMRKSFGAATRTQNRAGRHIEEHVRQYDAFTKLFVSQPPRPI